MEINKDPLVKEKHEINKIIAERKSIIIRQYYDIIKGVILVIGSIIFFITIQKPESILNQKASKETINRERANLILNLVENNDDPANILLGLSVIKKSYPNNDNEWITETEELFKTKVVMKKLRELMNIPIEYSSKAKEISIIGEELIKLYEQKEYLQYRILMDNNKNGIPDRVECDIDGFSLTPIMGGGIEDQFEEVNSRIKELLNDLLKFKDVLSYEAWINNALQQ